MLDTKEKKIMMGVLAGVIVFAFLYLSGVITVFSEYRSLLNQSIMLGEEKPASPSLGYFHCLGKAFTGPGLKITLIFILLGVAAFFIIRIYSRFTNKDVDERGFKIAKDGSYGTARWMKDSEMREVFEIASPHDAEGIILGEKGGKVICMPKDTKWNRHIAIFGASGTMKSRAIIRNTLFQAIKRNESCVITDPKGELYSDTAELFKKHGYEVRVYNLVNPEHGDSWNCMSDLNGDTLLAAVLTNVIIGNTSSGKGDHFWDNGESNLLKALILYVDSSSTYVGDEKNLGSVYRMITDKKMQELDALFSNLPAGHPARAPYNLFAQASDTVKQGIVLGLGTRLQVLQNEAVRNIITNSDIDLTAPAAKPCAYFIIQSDQDSTMSFLSSLFFSCFFIKLTRFADKQPGGKCPVPVNLILDEFNNVGRIGGAADGSDFAKTLSVIRSRDVKIMIAVQSLGQLENRYPNNLWAEIIGNCDVQLMLGCTDDVTAEYISGRSGEMSIEVDSTRIQKKTLAPFQIIPNYMESQGSGKRMLLTPDEVLRLPHQELLVIARGQCILKLKKFDYTKHPMSKEIVPCSLYDYSPRGESDSDDAMPISDEDSYMAMLGGTSTKTPSAKKPQTSKPKLNEFQPKSNASGIRVDEYGEVIEDGVEESDDFVEDDMFDIEPPEDAVDEEPVRKPEKKPATKKQNANPQTQPEPFRLSNVPFVSFDPTVNIFDVDDD